MKPRSIFNRHNKESIGVVMPLAPGEDVSGCCVCCSAPSCCAMCAICPCCEDSQYVKLKRESSKYILIREHSIEWNDPQIILKTGSCCGVDPCEYDVQDNVTVLYFDDPVFYSLTDRTRCCNESRTCISGGRGERLQMSATCCCGLCIRSTFPCPVVPSCLPRSCIPWASIFDIYTTDAQKGLYEIKKARARALTDRGNESGRDDDSNRK